MFTSLRKKIAVDQLVYPWNVGLSCGDCAQQFTVARRKKQCVFCNTSVCSVCIERKPDKRLSCHKCVVLMARPIDREQLFNLKTRDLAAYLSSRHISTSDCIEKEDLVNAVVRSVNVPPSFRRSNSGSCPSSPQHSNVHIPSTSYSQEDIREGIRVRPMAPYSGSSPTSPEEAFVMVDPLDCLLQTSVSTEGESISTPLDAPTSGDQLSPTQSPIPSPSAMSLAPDTPPAEPKKRLQLSDIPNIEDLDALSIRQVKELLAFNRIDFSGCVERPDLMEKVSRLWKDYNDSRKAVDQLSHDDLCKICMDAPIECVLLECGHTCTCTLCGKQLSECPICRQFVIRCVRTFKA